MDYWQDLRNAFEEVERQFQSAIGLANRSGDESRANSLRTRKETVDLVFFGAFFAQFEQRVNEKFKQACDARQNNTDWTQRRGWDLAYLRRDVRSIEFRDRLALVLDSNGSEYSVIMQYYGVRNSVAHGRLGVPLPVASVTNFANDLHQYSALLRS